jgi:hypothetical protein
MATYIQGVQAYVPQFQPYQPDLNFESNLLQQAQSKYDTNYKALNNVYGQYFYADLTRESDIKKKEQLMKDIEFNLQRISGLDLSQSKNVDQAMQVFRPFYEDKVLMKDMAWTKVKNAQRGYGTSLKNSTDVKERGMYWNEGIQAIDYLTEEFAASSDSDSMKINNVAYTPFRNVAKEARLLAKEAGISMNTPSFSNDGKWMYQTKNGQQIIEPLSKLFESELGKDPGIQDVFKTYSYVERKNYIENNAAQFNGDKKAAEMQYLQDNFKVLKDQISAQYKIVQNTATSYDQKIKDTEASIKNGTARDGAEKFLETLKENKAINDAVLKRFDNQNEEFLTSESSGDVSTGFVNPYGDIESLRNKVDNGVTWNKLSKTLNEAANYVAYIDYSVTQKENPYAVIAEKAANEMAQIRARNAGTLAAVRERNAGSLAAARARNQGEASNIDRKWRLESGTSVLEDVPLFDNSGNPIIDPRTGKQKVGTQLVDNNLALFAHPGLGEGGNFTEELDARKTHKHYRDKMIKQYSDPYWKTSRDILNLLSKDGQFSYEDLKRLQYGTRELKKGEKVRSLDQFMHDMSKYSSANPYRIEQVKKRLDGYINAHANLPTISRVIDNKGTSVMSNYQQESQKFNSYIAYAENNADYVKKTSDLARTELLRRGFDKNYVDLAIDKETGRTRSSEEFLNLWKKKYGSADRLNSDSPNTVFTGADNRIYDPSKGKKVEITNKNYNEVITRIGKHILDNSDVQVKGSTATRFYDDGNEAKQAIQSALGTNEGVDAVFITKEGKRISINDNKDAIKNLIKSSKSYLIKNTKSGGWFSDNGYEIREVDKSTDRNKIIKDLGNGYVFNMWTNPKTKNDSKAVNAYSDIQKELNSVYASSDIMKVGIPTSGNNEINPGTAQYSQSSVIQVLPLNRTAPGTQAMFDVFRDMETLDFDGMSSIISFTGSDLTDINNNKLTSDKINDGTWDKSSTKKGQTLLRALYQDMLNPSANKTKAFAIEYQSIAGSSLDNESIIIRPSIEWLEKFKETKEGNNILNNEDFVNLQQHGINMIVPSGTFNNTLTRAATMTPFDSNVQYKSSQGIPVTYSDQYGSGNVSIQHDRANDQYVITLSSKEHGFSESYYEHISNGEEAWNNAIRSLDMLSQQSNNIQYED